MPLVLDAPNNRTGKRLYPLQGPQQDRKLILWMNDYLDCYTSAPSGFRPHYDTPASEQALGLAVTVVGNISRFKILAPNRCPSAATPMTIFRGQVTGGSSLHRRPTEGDLYTVIFSAADSEQLFRCVFAPHRLQVRVVALQRQGGYSCQRAFFQSHRPFEQYQDVPRILTENERLVGKVEAYLVDHDVEIPGYRAITKPLLHWGSDGTRMWVPEATES